MGSLRRVLAVVGCLLAWVMAVAQPTNISGVVKDAKTGEGIPYAQVKYEGKTVGTTTDYKGEYSIVYIAGGRLAFSSMSYKKKVIPLGSDTRHLDVGLEMEEKVLAEATVKAKKKKKYSRENNPAVELMRKVIEAKKSNDYHNNDYFSYDKYEKLTFAVNNVSDKIFQEEEMKKLAFMKDHVEICPETGNRILPISFQEKLSRHIYRKDPKSEKDIITGTNEEGLNEMFNTGEILNVLLEDCFTEVDIYQETTRLFQMSFISPISTHYAINFYRYFIADTLDVDGVRCIEVTFTPNNPQDMGFMGSLYIMADSTYRVNRVNLEIPGRSDVNYVDHLDISQKYVSLPTGEQVVDESKMTVQLRWSKKLFNFQVQQLAVYRNYSSEELEEKDFKFAGSTMTLPDAGMKGAEFWEKERPVSLSQTEADMYKMMDELWKVKNFRFALFVLKAFIENFVETSTSSEHPSKVDIGPVNTMISQNFIDGVRLRLSAQTTANLNNHMFGKGYVAYGFRDNRWKGLAEYTYSFNKKDYLPREFPMHNLIVSYQTDVMSPTDKFMPTDKDNVFTSFKFTTVDQMMYYKRFKLKYQKEWNFGLRLEAEFNRERDEPCGRLFYQRLDGVGTPSTDASNYIKYMNTASIKVALHYQPGAKYINTKQRRLTINRDSPMFDLSHTIGLENFLGGDYNFNFTELGIYYRLWLPSAGKAEFYLKGGVQWNRVPFPLLIMPEANLSYITEPGMFNMINNMEFLNDRYVSLIMQWDLNGKLFNRIPLLRKLKWRELIGFNMLWGTLSDKNNPYLNPNDSRLFYFPGHFSSDGVYESSSFIMDKNKPYWEVFVGIHNIFRLVEVQLVRRLNYLDNPRSQKWGVRFMIRASF